MVEITLITLVAVVVGLVQVVKMIGLPARFAPVLSVLFGLGLSFIVLGVSDLKQTLLTGLVIGLSAVGLWSGTKNTVQ